MQEFIEGRDSERGQLQIAKAILSLGGGEYTEEKIIREFTGNPPSEYGQQAIANAIRYLGGQNVVVNTKEKEYTGNRASINGQKEIIDAIRSVVGHIGGDPVLEDKTVKSTDTQQTVTAGEGYDGIGTITVSPIVLETKTVKSTTTSQTVDPTSGKDGISQITVSPIVLETVNVTLGSSAQEITPSSGYDGIGTVNVPAVPAPNLQSKSVTPSNTSQTITADPGYDGLSSVVVGADSGTDTLATAFSSAGLSEYTITGNQTYPFNVKKINAPDALGLTTDAFNSLINLEELNAPNVTTLGARSLANTRSLKKITLGTISSVGSDCFQNFGTTMSTNQCDVTISATSWNMTPFSNAYFRNITFSELTQLGYNANLNNCHADNAYFQKLTTISNSFDMYVSSQGTLSMPELTSVGDQMAFRNELPPELTFPKLETVKGFYFSSYLQKITLPSATTIKANAFCYASNFTDIYLPGSTVCALENINAFDNVNSNFKIHVPSDLEATYKAETNWSSFASKIVGDQTAVGV